MHSELIDLLYENDAIHGVALFHQSGELLESHLALSEASVFQICSCINEIKQALAGSTRIMQGFLIKNDKYLLQVIIHEDLIILLQLQLDYSPEKIYQSLISQLGKTTSPSSAPAGEQSTTVLSQVAATTTTISAEEKSLSHQIDWVDFQQKLLAIISRVAPSGIAKKMISTAIQEAGTSGKSTHIDPSTAFQIGSAIVGKIPNKSRRKLIEKEYQLLVEKFQD